MKKTILIIVGTLLIFILGFWVGSVVVGMKMAEMAMAGPGGPPQGPPPAVLALEVAEQPLDVLDEYIASIEPVQDVMVRTEVDGYIDAVHFVEGSLVKEGDLLITIDQKQYQALVEVRQAELARANAELARSEKFLKRMKNAGQRSISQSDLDTAESDHLQAVANLKQAEANLNLAKIDLSYSEIRAPIGGRIGAAQATKGNYVTSSSEALAQIIQIDPMRVVFSMTDRAYLNLRSRELASAANELVAQVRLPNGAMLPMIGKKDFDDNQMNPETGTMAVRYLFDNPDSLLVAGGYVKIMLGEPERPAGICVPQQALMVDPQGSYVLTVDEEGLVGTARVELGKLVGTDREVLSGLKVGDRVVTEGVQKVQPGTTAVVTLLEAEK